MFLFVQSMHKWNKIRNKLQVTFDFNKLFKKLLIIILRPPLFPKTPLDDSHLQVFVNIILHRMFDFNR